jgi:streptogramin lyase
MWVACFGNGKVARVSKAGVVKEIALHAADAQPVDVAVGADASVWVTERANRIARIHCGARRAGGTRSSGGAGG